MKLSNGSSLSDMVQSYLSSETEIEGLHGVLLSFIHKSSSNCFLFFNTASTVAIRGGGIKTEMNYLTTRDNNVETNFPCSQDQSTANYQSIHFLKMLKNPNISETRRNISISLICLFICLFN